MIFLSQSQVARLSAEQRRTLTPIGNNPDTGDTLFITEAERYAGLYALGVQGSGKSGLLQNMIHADIQARHAVIVFDPHGDLIYKCLSVVPGDRMGDTYLLTMQDIAYPFGLNLFNTGRLDDDDALTEAVNRIEHIFAVLWPEVTSQANLPRYLRAAILTLLANPGSTLVDMCGLLQDQSFRTHLLRKVKDRTVHQFWQTQYDNLGQHERYQRVLPLIARLEMLFMGKSLVRNIVGQRKTTINLRRSIEQHEIIFIKLPIKTMTQEARLVGTILLSQIHAALFSFANIPVEQRPGVSLYIDEFQHFISGDIEELFTEGRKYGVRLTIAHQYRDKLPDYLKSATKTARTKVCFRLIDDDSREMARVFPSNEATIKPEDIEVHPAHYLLTHPSNDPVVREFVDTYLHPLQGYKRGTSGIRIDPWKLSASDRYAMSSEQIEHVRVPDPTYQLDSLLYDVMQSGNSSLLIPPEVVLGFSNCGKGFYKDALKLGYNDPLLQARPQFPRYLVVQNPDGSLCWTRKPESGMEQLFHFVFHLRSLMLRLAQQPIGKATVDSASEIASMLTRLPNRQAFVGSADKACSIYTLDTQSAPSSQVADIKINTVLIRTETTYCKPREEAERELREPPKEPPDESGGSPAKKPPHQLPDQPMGRWEEIA